MRVGKKNRVAEGGSIELIVLGLLAALIVVLAIPALTGIGKTVNDTLVNANESLYKANHP